MHLMAMQRPVNEQDQYQVEELASAVQGVTGDNVELAFVDQGYTGDTTAEAAQEHDIALHVVKLPEAKRGFVLLPRRWVVECSFGRMACFQRLARDYERFADTLVGLHFVAFVCLLLNQAQPLIANGS